ncbi:MAG: UDP-glucose/GDP-mannose dehydrogenase family protein [Candidatus Baltobacteraceae bacterium]
MMYGIAVFGCGYVGLVTAACLSNLGHHVVCFDTEQMRVRDLQLGRLPFYEPDLEPLIAQGRERGLLHFAASAGEALADADVAFIAVGTPTGPTGEADLTYVRQCVLDISAHAARPLILVNKSTVPVETADYVQRLIERHAPDRTRFTVASNPEFLREGSAVHDFMHPDRIVIGCADTRAAKTLEAIYAPLAAPTFIVDVHTAEMIKYAANAFLATKISFINEIANLCAAVDADVDGVIAGIAADARIGRSYLDPGLGFGGSCLPKDVAALASVARKHAIEPTMLDATLAVNRRQVAHAVRLIEDALGDLFDRRIAVAGVAFKAGTDDIRESPALVLVEALLTRGARVTIYDAHALARARVVFEDRVRYAESIYEAAAGADALAIANDDPSCTHASWPRVAAALAQPFLIDLRNKTDRQELQNAGLRYTGVGRAALPVAS